MTHGFRYKMQIPIETRPDGEGLGVEVRQNHSPHPDTTDDIGPLLAAGVFVSVWMFVISVTGILLSVSIWSIAVATILSAGATRLLCRRSLRWAFRGQAAWAILWLLPVLVGLIVCFLPPYSWDEVAYSVSLPRAFAAAHRFIYVDSFGPASAFPGNYEAVTTASLLLLDGPVAAKLLNIAMALGMALCATEICRRLGVDSKRAPLAGMFVLCAPAIVQFAPIAKNDIANAFFQALALVTFMRYVATNNPRFVVLSGWFLGTAVAIKYNSLQFAVVFCVTAFIAVQTRQLPAKSRWLHVVTFGLAAAASAAPWYLRNLFRFRNPFYPFFNDTLHVQNAFSLHDSALLRELFEGLVNYSWKSGTFAGFIYKLSDGFGMPVLVLGAIGALIFHRRMRVAGINVFLAVLVGFFAQSLFAGFWEPRYLLFLLVGLSALATAAIVEGCDLIRRRWSQVFVSGVVIAGVVAALLFRTYSVDELNYLGAIRTYVSEPKDTFLERSVSFWPVANWLNEHIPAGQRVGLGVNVQPFYYLNGSWFNIHPFNETGNLSGCTTSQQFLQAFRGQGLSYLAVWKWYDEDAYPAARTPHLHAFLSAFYGAVDGLQSSGNLVPIKAIGDVKIYRIIY
ncbi:ArnT family glycosyltransferase [Burkholderia sp. F1]|uniref:ArnT family glycosyltransferase n=1 Tax=Burkholderia sp. F1 TaxID=3366817 RepID=UPI003D73D683